MCDRSIRYFPPSLAFRWNSPPPSCSPPFFLLPQQSSPPLSSCHRRCPHVILSSRRRFLLDHARIDLARPRRVLEVPRRARVCAAADVSRAGVHHPAQGIVEEGHRLQAGCFRAAGPYAPRPRPHLSLEVFLRPWRRSLARVSEYRAGRAGPSPRDGPRRGSAIAMADGIGVQRERLAITGAWGCEAAAAQSSPASWVALGTPTSRE
jgi:hypothetical protein